ncbi:MAG: hypothetical protein J6W08_00445 [Alphaproteobacteria bacterium]|nr:hypothetical protein [Alphaproteobacteria bacterium]
MAYTDMNDFLKRYFRQMHVNHMPPEVVARLQDDYKKGTLNKDQLDWISKYFTVTDGKLTRNSLPDPASDAELEPNTQARKLYVEIYKTLAKMKGVSHLYTLKDQDATDFLNRWFDTERLQDGKPAFSIPQANAQTEASIKNFLNLLGYGDTPLSQDETQTADQIKQIIRENTLKDNGTDKVFDDQYAVNDFLQKCKDGKYNSDNKVQDKLLKVASALKNHVLSHYDADEIPTVKALKPLYQDLENISSDYAFDKIEITNENLKEFRKNKLPIILKTLYENGNVRAKFKDYDQSKIVTDQLEKYSENKIAWQDSQNDNYVQPKLDDVRTPLQQLEKWAGDTYNNTLKKYEELRGGHLFFGAHAKEICKAIDKEKIKPADGLAGLLAKKDAIKKRLENKNTESHFDWFTKTMEELSPQIPKAIEGCWKDARQMKCVIQNIILKATDPRTATEEDFKKAKTAMEIMTVMKYGMMTSKVMDALKQEDFKIFSDGELSWNKNEGIQFVTKCFDKSIKAAFLGVGYGITFIRNKIMMSGMKFKNKNNQKGPLQGRIDEIKKGNSAEKLNKQNSLQAHRQDLATQQNALNQYTQQHGTQQQIEQNMQNVQNDMNTLQQKHDDYETNKGIVDQDEQLKQQIDELTQQIADKQQEISQALNKYNNPASYPAGMPQDLITERKKEYYVTYEKLQEEQQQLTQQKTDLENQRTSNQANVNNARNMMSTLQGDYNQYNQLSGDYNDLKNKKEHLETATATINELNTAITNEQNALNTWDNDHKNKVIELENYWNFLQTGDSKTWRLFTSRAQEKFDTEKGALFQKYISQHGMAA